MMKISMNQKYFINHFLDHFIGRNFGLSVHRKEKLKKELEELNEKVISMGIREYAGSKLEVSGNEDRAVDGLQHYKLPIETGSKRSKIKLWSFFNKLVFFFCKKC